MDRYVIKYIQGAYENLWDITNYMVGTMGLFYDKPSTVTSSGSVVCYLSSVISRRSRSRTGKVIPSRSSGRSPRRITRPLFR